MKKGLALLVALAALALASTATASDRYAGLTRSEALVKAKRQLIALSIAFNGTSPKKAAEARRWLDKAPAANVEGFLQEDQGMEDRLPRWR